MNEVEFESNSLFLYPSDVAKVRVHGVITVEMGLFWLISRCLTLDPDLLPPGQVLFERNNGECGDRDEIGMQFDCFDVQTVFHSFFLNTG